jgi:hypothetical protein
MVDGAGFGEIRPHHGVLTMIAWSKGLGKQTLLMELDKATVRVEPAYLAMEGMIDSVCWNYAIKLEPDDLREFLKLLANRETVRLLAEHDGILFPFLLKLIAMIPGLLVRIVKEAIRAKLGRKESS